MEEITKEDVNYLNSLKQKYSGSYSELNGSLNISDEIIWSKGSVFNLRPYEIERSRYGFGRIIRGVPKSKADHNEYLFNKENILRLNKYNKFGLFEAMFKLHNQNSELLLFYRKDDLASEPNQFRLFKIIDINNIDKCSCIVLLMEEVDGAMNLLKELILPKEKQAEIHQVSQQVNSAGKTELLTRYIVDLNDDFKVERILGFRRDKITGIEKELAVYPKES